MQAMASEIQLFCSIMMGAALGLMFLLFKCFVENVKILADALRKNRQLYCVAVFNVEKMI